MKIEGQKVAVAIAAMEQVLGAMTSDSEVEETLELLVERLREVNSELPLPNMLVEHLREQIEKRLAAIVRFQKAMEVPERPTDWRPWSWPESGLELILEFRNGYHHTVGENAAPEQADFENWYDDLLEQVQKQDPVSWSPIYDLPVWARPESILEPERPFRHLRPGLLVALHAVKEERIEQDERWGWPKQISECGVDPHRIVEFGRDLEDVARAAMEEHGANWMDILLEEVGEALKEPDPVKRRAELVQVAAVALAWVEELDRQAAEEPS